MSNRSVGGRPLWILEPGPAQRGGGWLFALRLAISADREVTIACPAGSPVDRAAADAGVPVFNVSFPAPIPTHALAMLSAAASLRRSVPADVLVVSGAIRASLAAGIARLPNPVVHLMHERDSASRPSVRLALRRSPAVVVVGVGAAQVYRKALPGACVTAVNNFLAPYELEAFVAVRSVRAAAAPGTPLTLGVVARLIREKGVDVLVQELARIPDLWSRLIVAGDRQDQQYVRELEEQIRRHGLTDRIEMLGPRTDLPEIFAQLDALIVPSTGNEGQPTVILEALAAGLPVVARSPVGGPEFDDLPVVAFDGPTGLAAALRGLPSAPADPDVLAERFAAGQVLERIDAAADRAI